ncbi:hypothetical protein D3Z55_15470 [Clostridiaceae bacterium]|nr:hypothetical protein [Clostridiaceae bacterium]
MKTRKTFYNAIVSICYYFLTIILGIFNRKIVIDVLGIEYQGINGLFNNIMSMLSIAELGIGISMIYHLYLPLENKNLSTIRSLMNFYKKCYIIIAGIIFSTGILIIPGLKYIIQNYALPYSLPEVYIWFLLDSVCSYLFSYKRSILIADQKNYVIILCDILYQFISKIGQIIILLYSHSFILYLSVMVISRLVNNLFISFLVNRQYPYLKTLKACPISSDIYKDIKQKVKGSFFHKIGGFVVLGTDNILISKFLGLETVGIYSNYFLIINSIKSICSQILTSSTASVGHLLTEKNNKKAQEIFSELYIVNSLLVNCATTVIYCVITPFIRLLFGKQYIISEFTLFILSLNFYIMGMRTVYSIFKEAGGILYEDRFIPIIESTINFIASLIFLHYFKLAGVFMGTILSSTLLFGYTYPYLICKKLLKISIVKYWKELLWNGIITLISMIFSKILCNYMNLNNIIYQVSYNLFVSIFVSNILFLFLYAYWKPETKNVIIKCKLLFFHHSN